MMQEQLKIAIYTPTDIISYVYSYIQLIKTQQVKEFSDACISSCSVDSNSMFFPHYDRNKQCNFIILTGPNIKITTVLNNGSLILRDVIDFNADVIKSIHQLMQLHNHIDHQKTEDLFRTALSLFQNFQLNLENEHRLKDLLEGIEEKVISLNEPLRELFFVTAIDKGYYRAIIDILKDSGSAHLHYKFFKL